MRDNLSQGWDSSMKPPVLHFPARAERGVKGRIPLPFGAQNNG